MYIETESDRICDLELEIEELHRQIKVLRIGKKKLKKRLTKTRKRMYTMYIRNKESV